MPGVKLVPVGAPRRRRAGEQPEPALMFEKGRVDQRPVREQMMRAFPRPGESGRPVEFDATMRAPLRRKVNLIFPFKTFLTVYFAPL